MSEEHPEMPDLPPQMPAPPGAQMWNSGERSLRDVLPDQNEFENTKTMRAIEAINMGVLHDSCTQLDGYGPEKLSAQVDGELRMMNAAFGSNEDYENWVKKIVDEAGAITTWADIEEHRMGVLDLPGGERFAVFLPSPGRQYLTFSLRKHGAKSWPTQSFVELGTLNQPMMDFLRTCVAAHVNILFVGAMGSGKTTLLRALAQDAISDDEKIAVVEQVPELSINKPLVVEYVYQPKIPAINLHEVLDYNLYNGLSRLIVGEVHMEGLTKMLETMIITEGSMSTYHAYSTEQAGERMKLAIQTEHTNLTAETAAGYIRQAVDLVVVLEKLEGVRRVTQITEIDWRASGGADKLSGADLFMYDQQTGKFRGMNLPDKKGDVVKKCQKYNLNLPQQWFIESQSNLQPPM